MSKRGVCEHGLNRPSESCELCGEGVALYAENDELVKERDYVRSQLATAQRRIELLEAVVEAAESDDHEWYLQAKETERLTTALKNQQHTCGVLAKDKQRLQSRIKELEAENKELDDLNYIQAGMIAEAGLAAVEEET